MSNGSHPGPLGVDDGTGSIDYGTLSRIGTPAPGPIGLDAKGGSAKGTPASIPEQIVTWARRQEGKHIGDGQCFAYADESLRNAGAKSAADYGTITKTADYVWGQAVDLAAVAPGDVVQFRDYIYDLVRETKQDDGTPYTWTEKGGRPHHTAIVESVSENGVITVLEQNAPQEGAPVVKTVLYFKSGTFTEGQSTTRVTIKGKVKFYRAQPK